MRLIRQYLESFMRLSRFSHFPALALTLFLSVAPALAQDGVLLKNHFTAGERAEMTLISEVTGTLSGQPVHYNFTLVLGLATERLLPDGGAEIAVDLRSLSMKGRAQGQDVDQNWDSAKLASLGMKNTPLRAVIAASGRVVQVTGDEQLSLKTSAWLDFRKYLMEGELLYASLPDHAVKVGESWNLPGEVGIPFARGKILAQVERTLMDVKTIDGSRRALLKSVSKAETGAPPAADPDVVSGVQLKRCKQEIETQLVFDVDKGHVLETRQNGTFAATLIPIQPAGLKLPPSETQANMEVRIETHTTYQ